MNVAQENNPLKLRRGYSTGACATATTIAAARLLLLGEITKKQEISLPRGEKVSLSIIQCESTIANSAYASTIKDAGDDPDVMQLLM